MNALDASYAACRRLTRRAGSSFYYPLWLLSRDKRRAMWALYSFMRRTDDLGDNEAAVETRRAALAAWRTALERALAGEFDDPILPALADAVARYGIPPEHLRAAIGGVEMDLDGRQYATFAELETYCDHVASAVGLACIHVWGFSDPAAFRPARQCGIAFQLTNILRDLKEDAAAGRVYLPQEDLARFDYTVEDLRQGVRDSRFVALMQFEIARAELFYAEAETLGQWLTPDGRAALAAMTGIYRDVLDQIKRRGGDVFSRRVRVSRWRKLKIAAQSLAGALAGAALRPT